MKSIALAAVLVAASLAVAHAQDGLPSSEGAATPPAHDGVIPRCLITRDRGDCTPLSLKDALLTIADEQGLAFTGDAAAASKMVAEKALEAACTIPAYREQLADRCPKR